MFDEKELVDLVSIRATHPVTGGCCDMLISITDPPSFANPPDLEAFRDMVKRRMDPVSSIIALHMIDCYEAVRDRGVTLDNPESGIAVFRRIVEGCIPDGTDPDRVTAYHLLKSYKRLLKRLNG